MLATAKLKMMASKSVARAKRDEPNKQTSVHSQSTIVPYKYRNGDPSGSIPVCPFDSPSAPMKLSTKPSTFIAALKA